MTENDGLEGNIVSVPLILEDHASHTVIKTASLYIHSYFKPTTNELWITGMCQEGCFHALIDKSTIEKAISKDFTYSQWMEIIQLHFSGAEDKIGSLTLSARYETLKDYYDEELQLRDDDDMPVISETMVLLLKTQEALAKTKAKFSLSMVDSEEDSLIQKEQNLFHWIEKVLQDNTALRKKLAAATEKMETFSTISKNQQEELENSHKEHKQIIKDIQEKLYAVLNAKKARIWQLEGKHSLKLDYLNEIFEAKRAQDLNNRRIDVDNIPTTLDSIYVRERKRKAKTNEAAKKKIKKENEDEDKIPPQTDENESTETDLKEPEEPQEKTRLRRRELGTVTAPTEHHDTDLENDLEQTENSDTESEATKGSTDYGSD